MGVTDLQVGSVVQLLSGGPPMTIEVLDGQTAVCVWFDDTGALHNAPIAVGLLRTAAPRGRGSTMPQGVLR